MSFWKLIRCECEELAKKKFNKRRTGIYKVYEIANKRELNEEILIVKMICKTCKRQQVYEVRYKQNSKEEAIWQI